MNDAQFILDGNLLNQVQQPILFAKNNRFVHSNQAAAELLALGGEDVANYLTDEDFAALGELTPGQSAIFSMAWGQQFYDATVTKEVDQTVFLLSPRETEHLSLGVLPSVAAAIRKPLVDAFGAMDQLIPILEEMENEEYQALTAKMRRSIYRLFRLSANMFDYPMLLNKTRDLFFEKVKLDDYFYDKFDQLESLCYACDVQLEADLTLRQYNGYLDQQQVYRLLLNLVSNAIAASNPGGTTKLKVEARGQMLKIQVEDTGVGIPSSVLGSVFHRFDNGELHKKGGTSAGFGLALAREIAKAHGGTMMVKSGLGQGVVMVATLKLDKGGSDVCSNQTKVDYVGGHEIWAVEMSELLPDEDYDSRAL